MTCYSYSEAGRSGYTIFPRSHRHKAVHAAWMRGGGDPQHRGGPWGEPPFGFGGPRGGFRGRHGKARRGDIRTAALLLLAEEPRNGYQIMQEVEERSGGRLEPQPGIGLPRARPARGRGR